MKGRQFDWIDEAGNSHWVSEPLIPLPPPTRWRVGYTGWSWRDLTEWAAVNRAARQARRQLACVDGGQGGEGVAPTSGYARDPSDFSKIPVETPSLVAGERTPMTQNEGGA